MSELNHIWLAPICHEDGDGRLWCQDDVFDDDCGCGIEQHPAVRYVIASEYDSLEQECERLRLDNLSKNGSIKAFGSQVAALQRAVKNRDKLKDRAESERDKLLAQVEAMRADAERFHFVFSCPSPMIQIELEALRGEPKTIDWYRQKIDACIALQAKP